ncbi:MAG: hypothetical protein IT324_04995 [Anaerolineae bacterium]|nr:hypothetical protein [Anaerolineae bacterium]
MNRSRLIGIVLLVLVALPIVQRNMAASQEAQRPAQVMLRWGTDHLPYPDWTVRIEESKADALSVWKHEGAQIRYRQLFDFGTYSMDKLQAMLHTDKWLKATLQDYGAFDILAECVVGNMYLFDFKAQSQKDSAVSYRIRYWVWSDAQAFSEVLMSFGEDQAADLEATADKLFGQAARCDGGAAATKAATTAAQ